MKWRAILLMLVLLLCLSACAAPDGSLKEEQAKKTEWQSAGGAFKQTAYEPSDVGAVFSGGENIYALGTYMSESEPMTSRLWCDGELIYSVEGELSAACAAPDGVWAAEKTYFGGSSHQRFVLISPTGDELKSFELPDAVNSGAPRWAEDRLYILSRGKLLITSSDGALLAALPYSSESASVLVGGDGRAYFISRSEKETELSIISPEGLSTALTLRDPAAMVFGGNGDYLFLRGDETGLYGLDAQGAETPLIIWADCGIAASGLVGVTPLKNGEYILRTSAGVSRLSPIDPSKAKLKTELVLAAVSSGYSAAVLASNFSRQSEDYFVSVKDYSQYDTVDAATAIARLNTDIISGKYPDLILFDGLYPAAYMGKGLLLDLSELIAADPGISAEDIAILPQLQGGGGLYYLCGSFAINSAVGLYSRFGDAHGWTLEEFFRLEKELPEGTNMHYNLTKQGLLREQAIVLIPSLVDLEAGSCRFDSEEFISILDGINQIRENPESTEMSFIISNYDPEYESIPEGRNIYGPMHIGSVWDMAKEEERFGCRLSFMGAPTPNGDCGSSLNLSHPIGICQKSANIDGCWKFLKYTLTGFDYEHINSLPVYAPYLRQQFSAARQEATEGGVMLNAEDEERFYSLLSDISSVSMYDEALLTIIAEEGEALFSGRTTAGQAAQRIQSRASLYVSEQS